MVTRLSNRRARERGVLLVELLAAMALLTAALIPIAYSIASERRLARAYYQRAVAMEIVDGEMEVLAAGEWRSFKPGAQDYPVHAAAISNLPPGRFMLEVKADAVRLEWQPSEKMHGGPVVREAKIK